MTQIKAGDIVASNGRIATQQDGRRRYIEFEAALVVETGPDGITVNPVGKNAVLICQRSDLHIAKAAAAKPAPEIPVTGTVVESTATTKTAPTLKGLKPAAKPKPAEKPAPNKRPPAKRTAMRRKRAS